MRVPLCSLCSIVFRVFGACFVVFRSCSVALTDRCVPSVIYYPCVPLCSARVARLFRLSVELMCVPLSSVLRSRTVVFRVRDYGPLCSVVFRVLRACCVEFTDRCAMLVLQEPSGAGRFRQRPGCRRQVHHPFWRGAHQLRRGRQGGAHRFEAYYAPFLKFTLLSAGILQRLGYRLVELDSEACRPGKWIISYKGQPVFEAFNKGDIYMVPIVPPVPVASALVSSVSEEEHLTAAAVRLEDPLDSTGQPDCAVKATPSGETGPSCFAPVLSRTSCKPLPCDVVHRRLAHLSASGMKSLVSNGLCVEGELGDKSFEHCTVCMEGKMTRCPFLSRPLTQRATKPMERLHLEPHRAIPLRVHLRRCRLRADCHR